MKFNGYEISYTRRRYGRTTFTWIYFLMAGQWQSTGDPLQKIMPSKKDRADALERAKFRFRTHAAPEKSDGE